MKGKFSSISLYFLMLIFLFAAVGCDHTGADPESPTVVPGPAHDPYTIYGAVTGYGKSGVVITLTNAANASTATQTTNADGTYTFSGLANGTYTLVPVLAGSVFDPGSAAVVVNGSDMIQNFAATATTGETLYSISGTVVVGSTPLSGVKVTLSGAHHASVITGADGKWAITGVPGGAVNNYTVTAYLSGYSITPVFYSWNAPIANSPGNVFTATAAKFSQADLIGTWVIHKLKSSTSGDKWEREIFTIDEFGYVYRGFNGCEDPGGFPSCQSAGQIKFTIINTATGLISMTGSGDATEDSTTHITMAADKTFAAGTQTSGAYSTLLIMQKKVDGVAYKLSDITSKNFVFHQLMAGDDYGWEYAAGSTSVNGLATFTTNVSSSGSEPIGATNVTFSEGVDGIVTAGGDIGNFKGFLSADKKTIVGTSTKTDASKTYYNLFVMQITDGQSSSVSAVAGTWHDHLLTVGTGDYVPFWAHQTIDITSAGVMTFSDWVCSNGSVLGPAGTETVSIGGTGTATLAGSALSETSFNGQLSYDGMFMVGTQTYYIGDYSLFVITR